MQPKQDAHEIHRTRADELVMLLDTALFVKLTWDALVPAYQCSMLCQVIQKCGVHNLRSQMVTPVS